jgi:hypothetical protein
VRWLAAAFDHANIIMQTIPREAPPLCLSVEALPGEASQAHKYLRL